MRAGLSKFVAAGLACMGLSAMAQHGVDLADIRADVPPCSDFYAYANGAWRASHAIPQDMDRWSKRWASGEMNKAHVRAILDETSSRQDWPRGSAEQLAGDFYAACMNQAQADAAGLAPLHPLLADIQAIQSRREVQVALRRLHDIGIGAGFNVTALPGLHDPTRMLAHVVAGGQGLPDRDYYLLPAPRFVQARGRYLQHVERMLVLAGYPAAQAGELAARVFAMERRLARASLGNVALRDLAKQDHMTSFAGLGRLAPSLDWAAYFDAASLPRSDLNVTQPGLLRQLDRELRTTPVADWRLYLAWQLLRTAAPSLGSAFVEESFSFNGRYLTGATEMKPRWKRCAEATDELLGDALGQKFVERHFPPQAKAKMQDMAKVLLQTMGEVIRDLDWMSATTKARALEKLASFNLKIGYPDAWKTYAAVEIKRDNYWADVLAATRWNVADNRAQIGKPVDRGRWDMTPPTSNAYYNPALNEIVFPAGILQPPGFDMNATDAVNYGGIGVVIGHEITHGFDDQGAKFDAQGALRNWWTPQDLQRFKGRAACVSRQFEGYFIEPGVHHNGALVLGEAIADLGGAKLAYLGYQRSRAGKGPEATIDGFTPEQQFFIAWGQWRGDETRLETQRLMVQHDEHPVARYRVIGTLSNLPAFSAAFQCKPNDAMVRKGAQRCEVW